MFNVFLELLYLVDFVMMGKMESLEKLKNIVSGVEIFGNGEEVVKIVYLVVDFFFVMMGGVEFFEEDEDGNFFSVMLNFSVVIVLGEFIFWFFVVGDFEDFMFFSIRMVSGLFVMLRVCISNSYMCCVVGLLGVLFYLVESIFVYYIGLLEKLKWDGIFFCFCI